MKSLKIRLLAGLGGLSLLAGSGCNELPTSQSYPINDPYEEERIQEEEAWNDFCSSATPTGVVPLEGNFSVPGLFSYANPVSSWEYHGEFRVLEEGKVIEFTRGDSHATDITTRTSISNGVFNFRHGGVYGFGASDDGTAYPNDGFYISGHFVTPTKAVGKIGHNSSTNYSDFIAIRD